MDRTESIFKSGALSGNARTEEKMKTTHELMNTLQHIEKDGALEKYVSDLDRNSPWTSFGDYFDDLLQGKGLTRAQVIRDSGLDRTYCYQILDGSKKAGRDKILSLLIAAHANLKEVQRALEISGQGILYPRRQRDAILIFSIRKALSIESVNELLEQFGENALQ